MNYKSNSYMAPMSLGKQFNLLLTAILVLLLAACGGGSGEGGGGSASASCTLTQEQLDNLTPDDVASLPAACDGISFFDIPSIGGPNGKLFILGTEVDGGTGELKLYVHGLKRNGTAMTLADFQQAVVTLNGIEANPAHTVALASASTLSISLLADYSVSIAETELKALGDLYDVVLAGGPAGLEAEVINFSSLNGVPDITIKPDPFPYWTDIQIDLLAATDFDATQSRDNTTLYDAIGTGMLGPLAVMDAGDELGLVERSRPARVLIAQTDGVDNASETLSLADVTALIDQCKTTAIMLGTSRSVIDDAVLDQLAGDRGAFVTTVNSSFLAEAIGPYTESLKNMVVFTLLPATGFAGKTVEIDVGGVTASESEPFNLDVSCLPI